jgi:predicted  nucleic acid-binding Zn-ribbon protein
MKRARALYQLQVLDTDIEQKTRRLREVESLLKETDELRAARAAAEQAEKRLKEARSRLHRLDLENQSLQSEIAGEERRLYGGRITIPKELRSLEDKIKNLKARREKLEDDVLETMMAVEEGEALLTETQTVLAHVDAEWQTNQASLVTERDRLKSSLARQSADREAQRAAVAPKDLAVYDNLYRRKGGQSVARVTSGACGACGVSVSARHFQAMSDGDELVSCSACERILYADR